MTKKWTEIGKPVRKNVRNFPVIISILLLLIVHFFQIILVTFPFGQKLVKKKGGLKL